MTKLGKSAEFLRNEFISEKGKELYKTVTDKIAVRNYVKKFDVKTPKILNSKTNNCVVKANNDSGGIMIIINGNVVFGSEKEVMKHKNKDWAAKKEDHWNYHNIKHQVFVEEYLPGHEIDYQFFCYKGRAGVCQIRNSKKFDKKGLDNSDVAKERIILRDNIPTTSHLVSKNVVDTTMPLPKIEMWKLADKMSEDFLFTRVDLFINNNDIYFGEYTFNPMGFKFEEASDKILWEHVIQPITGKKY